MRTRYVALFSLAVWLATWSFAADTRSEEPRALFNGKDLKGWDGDLNYWRVENGAIVGEIAPGTTLKKNTWLVWRGGKLADFELNLQFRLTGHPDANSGIQIRCQVDHVDHVSGYQADLDMGSTWLGRIYDEHGRALLVERGTRVHLKPDGARSSQAYAPVHQYPVLAREREWNDYRIIAVGERIDVYVNGTLFSSLWDQQLPDRDLEGELALQLHAGPETKIEFKDIRLESLSEKDRDRLSPFPELAMESKPRGDIEGALPMGANQQALNLDFETGTLAHWTVKGEAFAGQPLQQDGISKRWPGQTSNKNGAFFIGGYELAQDAATGTLESDWFQITKRYGGFLIGGGDGPATRVEVRRRMAEGSEPEVIASVSGNNQEQMRRVAVDLGAYVGDWAQVRLVDENPGGWGHLNFDDFRLYDEAPAALEVATSKRSTFNAILHALTPNPVDAKSANDNAANTLQQMHVPEGFSVVSIASEPRIHQPIAMTFDARGRLWVIEAHSYPQKRAEGQGLDRVLIFSDEDHDGRFESSKVFAEGLNLASGIEVGYGGVWIGAAPELLFLPDRNRDDVPDSAPEIVLDGFGYADTHETLNSFVWGPDGWLYGTQGVFNTSSIGVPGAPAESRQSLGAGVWRYHPLRKHFEVYAHGGSNPWGLDYDDRGQWFMTHCRSFWGKGGTTHVMQAGHYWNQVNSGYAPYISSMAPASFPHLQNFLLASARYDSGEGGAGKPGTSEIYGGHSHVGTMIYLGDNWPDSYRNHLLTHNLHGHQLNHQINRREAGGFWTVHAGFDVLFCSDPQYIGVDLLLGPDGAVYFCDWYDPRHCHNPGIEQWDRGNGRIYRMQYDSQYRPADVDWYQASDEALIEAQRHKNDWHARTARRVLAERYFGKELPSETQKQLVAMSTSEMDAHLRLRALWALHQAGYVDRGWTEKLLNDRDEWVRSWAIQTALEVPTGDTRWVLEHAEKETSFAVRRALASSMSRLPQDIAWQLGTLLAKQKENAADRDLPVLVWQGLARHWPADVSQALQLAESTPLAVVRDSIRWYAAKTSPMGRQQLMESWNQAPADRLARDLELLQFSLQGERGLEAPDSWKFIAQRLYASTDPSVRRNAELLGAQFRDRVLFDRLRTQLASGQPTVDWQHAITLLSYDPSKENAAVYLMYLDQGNRAAKVLPLLRSHDAPEIADAILARLPRWEGELEALALQLLASRPTWAKKLLDAVEDGKFGKERLNAYTARQIAALGDEGLQASLERVWGRVGGSPEGLRKEIARVTHVYKEAPLWAYDASAGQKHFQRLCASCHAPDQPGIEIAPKLQGTGAKGIDYAIENVIDPNAVIGKDYQARLIRTDDGQVITGLVLEETPTAIRLRTATDTVTIDRSSIEEFRTSENSFMPIGLLDTLDDRQRIELFKYLLSQ